MGVMLPPDPAPPDGAVAPAVLAALQDALPGAVLQLSVFVGDWTAIVAVDRLLEVAGWLRAQGFDACADVTATDWPERPERFDLIYVLYAVASHERIRVKTRAADGQAVPSVAGIWPAASWLEREIYDLFGVPFSGHPDLRRILMPDNWQGHPQRKDYPLEGPGELLMENPLDWLRVRQTADQADIE